MSEENATYEELQRVLDDPEFWFADCFMQGETLVAAFSETDWGKVEPIAWGPDEERWARFTACADGVQSRAALALSIRLLVSPELGMAVRGLTLLQCLHQEMGQKVGVTETAQLAEAWREHGELRPQLAQAVWRFGKSRALREAVGMTSWAELSARQTQR